MFWIDDFHSLVGDDVGPFDHTLFVSINLNHLGLVAHVLDDEAFNVEDDVGNVFHDAGNRADLVLHAVNLHLSDRAAFHAGEQNSTQAVAHSHAEAPFKWLDAKLAIGIS